MQNDFYKNINDIPIFFSDTESAESQVFSLQTDPGEGAVRVIRGWKCNSEENLHSELGAALQFPGYYGENWDALNECIADLDWLPGDWILIHLSQVESILPGDGAQFKIFLNCLHHAAKCWTNPQLRGLASTEEFIKKPFNILISGDQQGIDRARNLLTHAV